MKATSREFSFPLESLHSFFRSIHVKHIKSTSHKVRNNLQTKYINEYVHNGKSIIDLAKDANFSPALLTRRILEEVTNLDLGKKGALGAALKNPLEELGRLSLPFVYINTYMHRAHHRLATDTDTTTTTTTRLALEVKEAVESDPLCGPASDRAKHYIGIEYEIILERGLKNLGIPFESEAQLRQKGSARTPDVVLSSPIGVQIGSEWQVVCWIDSKALYGDVDTHQTSVLPQAESYLHRFGPGMIVYWFGHAPLSKLGNVNGDLAIVGWKLPETILWPDG
ncbi:hypothetical protein FRACYDRAFT_167013 [Fragilariopsis cylindrus CCMP1102]|uniref:CDAN1-interacting nuclease 1 n=1 Tax=Fragilariopsis cylindrus CCMP1102 TaxID=635003 RepID=A0A1E7FQV1_9STRA|nr:hypothetical protein FRACYDRAFT_167013 [Fragilariopsis cylindrus CCMP1102]|eukprot:OEU20551.1 hypothetical protein FRACYDRAFT_167013 [Fragilariopsis cylindrus CCMP1102]